MQSTHTHTHIQTKKFSLSFFMTLLSQNQRDNLGKSAQFCPLEITN